MSDDGIFEQVRIFLPKYLSPSKQQELYEGLKSFPDDFRYFSTEPSLSNEILQGDGWHGLVVIDFKSLKRKNVAGLILSNSCDIDPHNRRSTPPSVLFAPLIKMSSYAALLTAAGQSPDQISSVQDSIRKQKATSFFYLPRIPGVMEESMAHLGDVHPHPLEYFLASAARLSLFTLSQTAFYLLLVKLSIHFTRMQEDVQR